MSRDGCAFCDYSGPSYILLTPDAGVIAFAPLVPVTKGHLLVVPLRHVENATVDLEVTGRVMTEAARLAQQMGDCNLITSVGEAATQTVKHLHVHIVPRRIGDGLALPWTVPNEVRADVDGRALSAERT